MALGDTEIAFVKDLFADLGTVSTRKMFGGLGIYMEGTIFGVMRSDGALCLKGVGDMIDVYKGAGWTQWTHTRKNGVSGTMPIGKCRMICMMILKPPVTGHAKR